MGRVSTYALWGFLTIIPVPLFFVISGYVLSFRQVRMIRAGNFEQLNDTIFSAVFRRGIRLFIPVSVALVLMRIWLFMDWRVELDDAKAELPGFFWGLFRQHLYLIRPFQFTFGEGHLHQLWTIPVRGPED
jgi:peptidoglycan/LPS O-acetylase OafA/YrhL